MQKFLVIQTAFTGDVVLATALLEKLHNFFPDSQIDFLVRRGNEGLLTDHPFLHETLVWNKKENKNKNLLHILKKIRGEKYDKVINLQRFASTGILTAFSGAKETIGFDKNPFSFLFTKRIKHDLANNRHEVERNNELIKHFTDESFVKPRLYPSATNLKAIENYTSQPYVCIMPASVWFTKQYPMEKWIDFINAIPEQFNIFLLGGKEDITLCEEITKGSYNKKTEVLTGKLNFLGSVALMKGAVMNYTNDSAPLHFASASDAPVTAIFCSTVPAFGFYPLSEKSFIVETKELLTCRPCSLHGLKACPLGHFKCAYTIDTSQLLTTLSS
ncbi:MAG: glycosyltransferase family 9 protein [Bacteroidota bacterium]|nr:glycosyltransferase family 9 protein [Bacteroidota bacterium]